MKLTKRALILDSNVSVTSHRRALRSAVRRKDPVGFNRALYSPKGDLIGLNIGSAVRPEIVVTATGTESVAEFLARGGSIKVGAPCMKGAPVLNVKCNPTRVAKSRG